MAETRTAADVDELLANADWLKVLAGRLLEDDSEVDDLVHEAWVAALRRPADEVRNLPSWLAAVVCNLSRRRLRRTGRTEELRQEQELALQDGAPGPEECFELELVRRRVIDAVLGLPEPFRGTILMTYYEGLPPQEIARLSGVPGATVRTRLRRGLQRLRRKLEADSTERRSRAGLYLLVALRAPVPAARFAAPLAVSAAAAVLGAFALALWSAVGEAGGGSAALAGSGVADRPVAVVPEGTGDAGSAPAGGLEELSREVGTPTGTGSVDGDSGDCGGGLLLTGEQIGGPDGEPLLPQPAVRGTGRGKAPAERPRIQLASSGDRSLPPGREVLLGALRAQAIPVGGLVPAPVAERPGRANPSGESRLTFQPWPGLDDGSKGSEDEDDEDEHGERRPGGGHHPHPGPGNGGISLLGDPPRTAFSPHSKAGGSGAGSPNPSETGPHELVNACICPERRTQIGGEGRPARVVERRTRAELAGDPPDCPVHPADSLAPAATLWRVVELPEATLVIGFDRAALLERPWDAVDVVALVERSPEPARGERQPLPLDPPRVR